MNADNQDYKTHNSEIVTRKYLYKEFDSLRNKIVTSVYLRKSAS